MTIPQLQSKRRKLREDNLAHNRAIVANRKEIVQLTQEIVQARRKQK